MTVPGMQAARPIWAKKNVMIIRSGSSWKAVMICLLQPHSMKPLAKLPACFQNIYLKSSSILAENPIFHRGGRLIRGRNLTGVDFLHSYSIIKTLQTRLRDEIKQ